MSTFGPRWSRLLMQRLVSFFLLHNCTNHSITFFPFTSHLSLFTFLTRLLVEAKESKSSKALLHEQKNWTIYFPQAGRPRHCNAAVPSADSPPNFPNDNLWPALVKAAYAATGIIFLLQNCTNHSITFLTRLMKFAWRKSRNERQELRSVWGAKRRVSAV
jgi:hypothetical protein